MAVYIPHIRNYAPFYIQRESDALALDIQSVFGITVKVHEYPAKRRAKQPYRISWLDRDGDREYVDRIRYEAFTLRLSCVLMSENVDSGSSREELKSAAEAFRDAMRHCEFKIYDAWTKTGFTAVHLAEFSEISENGFREKHGRCRLIFDIQLCVNDPVTRVRFENGVISEIKDHGDELTVLAAEDGRYVITEDGRLILV